MTYALSVLFIFAAVTAIGTIGVSIRHLTANRHRLKQADRADQAPRLVWLAKPQRPLDHRRMRRRAPHGQNPMNRLPRHFRHPDAARAGPSIAKLYRPGAESS